jgi:hypothetical protein
MAGCDVGVRRETERERERERETYALVRLPMAKGSRCPVPNIWFRRDQGGQRNQIVSNRPGAIRNHQHNVMTMSRPPYLVVLHLALIISLSPPLSRTQAHRVVPRRIAQHAPVLPLPQLATGRDSGISAHGPICVRPAVVRHVARLSTLRIHRQRSGTRTSTTRGASSPATGHQTLQRGWSTACFPSQSRSSLTIAAAASTRSRIVRCRTYADQTHRADLTSPDPKYDFNKRLRRAFESKSPPPILPRSYCRQAYGFQKTPRSPIPKLSRSSSSLGSTSRRASRPSTGLCIFADSK